jgi:hypothetical protein
VTSTTTSTASPLLADEAQLRAWVERLCSVPRVAGSDGEREAAAWIADELRAAGGRVSVEREQVHGTYWWPIGLPTAAAALAARRGGLAGALVGALAAAAVADDITVGPRLLRRALPRREATNVVAEFGDPDAPEVLLLVAHHDAPHAGIVFHPELPRSLARRFPKAHARTDTAPPTMWGGVAGPALVALGSLLGSRGLRTAGGLLSAGYAAAMVDVALEGVTQGANDNATGVAALLSLARWLGANEPDGVRVILLSNGAEESMLEGMAAYARRHLHELPRERTRVVAVDCVGSPQLLLLEGEGMLGVREYPKPFLDFVRSCANDADVYVYPGLRFRNSTDGFIALKAGYASALIGSCDDYKFPTNYHWHTDTPDRVDYSTVADAARLFARMVQRLTPDGC